MSQPTRVHATIPAKAMDIAMVVKKVLEAHGSWSNSRELDISAKIGNTGLTAAHRAKSRDIIVTIPKSINPTGFLKGQLWQAHRSVDGKGSKTGVSLHRFLLDPNKSYAGAFLPMPTPPGEESVIMTEMIIYTGTDHIRERVQVPRK